MTSSVLFIHPERGVKFTKTGREGHGEDNGALGPGAYQVKASSLETKGGKFPKSSKDYKLKTNDIGPGAYEANKPGFGGKQGYSIAGKHDPHSDEQKPGPGQYDYGKQLDKRDWGQGFKLPQAEKRGLKPATDIAPGAYDIKDKYDGGFRFGKDKRDHLDKEEKPGPGTYEMIKVPLISPTGKFPKARRALTTVKGIDIGPGAYELNEKLDGGFHFGKDKRNHDHDNQIPGPGKYELKKVAPLSNLASFPKQPRKIGSVKNLIDAGPGQYDPKVENWSGGYSLGKDRRKGIADSKETPGVGQYVLKGQFDDQKHGYSFKRSLQPEKTNTTPGFYKPMYSVPDVPRYLLPPEPQRKIHL